MTDSTDKETNEEIEVEAVEDPDSYIQGRRLKDIFESRKTVRKQREKAKQYQIETGDNEGELKAQRYYRTAVENYLSELRPLFLSDELGKQYWYGLDIGTIKIQPSLIRRSIGNRPEELLIEDGDSTYSVMEEPDQKEIELTGIGCLFGISDPIVCEFELGIKQSRVGGYNYRSKTVVEKRNVPFSILDSIMNSANMYLQERGIELDPEEEEDPAKLSL